MASKDQQEMWSHFEGRFGRRQLLQGAGVLAAGGMLAACGSSGSSSTSASGGKPRRGGQLTIVTGDGLARDLFVGNSFGPQALAVSQFAWPLFRYVPGTFTLIPALASRYKVSPDAKTHTIELRSGLTFHDGSTLDAQAVADNMNAAFFERAKLRGPGSYLMVPLFWGGFPGAVDSIKATDGGTIVFQLNEPRADIRGALTFIPIYNPKVLANDAYGTKAKLLGAAGSGPFKVESFSPGQFVELSRVPGFFEEAYLDRLRIQLVPDASARFLALRSGQAQAAIGLSKADWDGNVTSPDYRKHVSLPGGSVFLGINTGADDKLKDPRVREALVRAMNREQYVSAFWGDGLAELASQVTLTPGSLPKPTGTEPLPYDPAGARRLLQQAGAEGLELSVISPAAFAAAPELSSLLSAAAQDLSKVGVKLNVRITDIAGWLAGTGRSPLFATAFGNSGGNAPAVAALYFNPVPGDATPPDTETFRKQVLSAQSATSLSQQNDEMVALMQDSAKAVAGIPVAYAASAALSRANVHDLAVSAAPIDPQNRAWIG